MRPLLFTTLASLCLAGAVHAQRTKATGEFTIIPQVRLSSSDDDAAKQFNKRQLALVGRPILVSLISDGKLVSQREVAITRPSGGYWVQVHSFRQIPTGRYDVKFEGEGVETVVRKGLQVLADKTVTVYGDLKAGKGTRVIEYGKEGDPLADIRARLKKLEAAVEALQKGK
ncbi:MAG: carboxypeptidase-like regulatory domain-containing protein [Gemmataceae bacterium]|nr:carboxypeptidase-like regulatory domain-containing protein [Gemmataceae bacterium]